MTIFAYLRVSTDNKGQTTDNQRKQILDAGFTVDHWHSEDGVSGSIKATERPEFSKMLRHMHSGDTLIVTMLDRLGRSAVDILNVVEMCKDKGIRVRVMQFDGVDLTSYTGKLLVTVMAAIAEMERNMLIERTNAGLERARAQGKKFGAPLTVAPSTLEAICAKKAEGATYDELASLYATPRATMARLVGKWSGKLEQYREQWNKQMEREVV